MTPERKVNSYGQEQIINSCDKLIKIGDMFLQVRLIKTKKWKDRFNKNGEFTAPMPRARFANRQEGFYYLISKKDLQKLKRDARRN
jgi:hypothetical protein